MTRLIDTHGAQMELTALKALLSQDCPRRQLGSPMNPCGAAYSERDALEKAIEPE